MTSDTITVPADARLYGGFRCPRCENEDVSVTDAQWVCEWCAAAGSVQHRTETHVTLTIEG